MYYLIPIILIVVFGVYYFTVIPKLKQQSEQGMQALKESLKGKEDELRKKYLEDANYLEPLAKEMKGEAIEGIVSCMEKRSVGQVLKQKFVNDLNKALTKSIGVGPQRIQDNQDAYYLVLTDKKLHYLVFDGQKLKQHLNFDFTQMKHVAPGKASISDTMLKGGQHSLNKIDFEYQDEKNSFFYYQSINLLPNKTFVGDVMAEWMILFAEPFERKLKEKLSV